MDVGANPKVKSPWTPTHYYSGIPTNGQIQIGSTGGLPVWTTLIAGSGVTITNGPGTITIAKSAGGSGQALTANFGQLSGTTIMASNAAPTITSGFQIATVTVTPASTNSKFALFVNMFVDSSVSNHMVGIAVFRGSTLVGVSAVDVAASGKPVSISAQMLDSPATAASITYTVRVGGDLAGTTFINQNASGGVTYGGTTSGAFTALEIL